MDELSYIADQAHNAPQGDVYDEVMSAMSYVRDAALAEIAALTAERDALRGQLHDLRFAEFDRKTNLSVIDRMQEEVDALRRPAQEENIV
jgi:hypothetical protein